MQKRGGAVEKGEEKGLRKWLEESCREWQRSVVVKRDGGKWWRIEIEENGGGNGLMKLLKEGGGVE